MAHAGDGPGLDARRAGSVAIDPMRVAADGFVDIGGLVDAVDVRPLLHAFRQIQRAHGVVGIAVPDRDERPGAGPRRRRAHLVAPLRRREVAARVHAGERRALADAATIGDARDDRATGEDVGIGRDHHRRHRATRGQTGDVDPRWCDGVVGDHAVDHLLDRQRLALAARDVAGLEPVEATAAVVRALLLRQQQGEAEAVREQLPAGFVVVARRGLRAAVQRDHHRRIRRQAGGHVLEHAQVAGVAAETGDFDLRPGRRRAQRAEQGDGEAMGTLGTRDDGHRRSLLRRVAAVGHSRAHRDIGRWGKLRRSMMRIVSRCRLSAMRRSPQEMIRPARRGSAG